MSTRAILAAVVGSISSFLLGWLIFGILLMDYYTANTTHYDGLMKEMPNLVLVFLNGLIWSLLLAFIFERWAGIKTILGGIKGGVIIGLPIMLSFNLFLLARMNLFTPTLVVVDVIANTIFTALVGGLIAFILGYRKKASA